MYFAIVDPHAALYRYFKVAQEKGYRTIALSANAHDCLAHESLYHAETENEDVSHIDELIECDVGSAQAIVEAIRPYRDEVAGMLPGNETAVPRTFEASAALGFDCARPEDARCQHVKSDMKERLVSRGVRTPRFRMAHTYDEAVAIWRDFRQDCMIKMVDYRASANVYRVTTEAELKAAWDAIATNSLELKAPFKLASGAVLEEYVGGREVTAEGFIADGRITFLNSCEKMTSDSFVVLDHFVPGHLSPAELAAVQEVVADCVRALGLHNTVFHAEVHLRDGLGYIIECAARPPGQHITEIIYWAYGIDLTSVNIDLAATGASDVTPRDPERYYALMTLYATETGILEEIAGLDELRRRGNLRRVFSRVRPGDRVEALSNFRHRYGWVILEDRTPEGIRAQAEWTKREVRLAVTDGPVPSLSAHHGSA